MCVLGADGTNYTGETCCPIGYYCKYDNDKWSDCQVGCGNLLKDQCGSGEHNYTGDTCCLGENSFCNDVNSTYSECDTCLNDIGAQCGGATFSGQKCCKGENNFCSYVDETFSVCQAYDSDSCPNKMGQQCGGSEYS
eukprot:Pgem_evm1s8649